MSVAAPLDFFGCAGDYRELAPQIHVRVEEVLASGQVLQGAHVQELEERIAATCGRRYAVAVGSGTDALFFALVALGIGRGDEVLVPDISFLASATAILRTGARPVFVDVNAGLMLDLAVAEAKVGPSTRAMVYVHLFGSVGDIEGAEAFARKFGLKIVEDFAQSLGASRLGREAGSMGEAGATSFDPTKVIGAPGSGGALVTDDAATAARVRRLRLHGKEGPLFRELGYNSQLPSLAAAILNLKLDRHTEWTARRAALADRYRAGLAGLPAQPLPLEEGVRHVWHKFVLLADDRDELALALGRAGIPTRIHYERPLHRESIFQQSQPDGEFPNALAYADRTLSLPIHSHLSLDDVDRVLDGIARHYA